MQRRAFELKSRVTMHKPWLASYVDGVPAHIDVNAFGTIADVYRAAIEQFPDNAAYTNFGKAITYRELDDLCRQFASFLLGELKLTKGDRVAIMLPNCLQYPVALFGALLAGLTVVNVNPLYTAREVKHQLEDAQVSVLVVMDNFGATVEASGIGDSLTAIVTTGLGDLLGIKGVCLNLMLRHVKKAVPSYHLPRAIRFRAALVRGSQQAMPAVDIAPNDLAFLQYTGGTTGVAKGAMLTHRNMVANMEQVATWFGATIRPGREVIITALPLYHIFALTCNCFIGLRFGGCNVLITNPRDMLGFVKELARTPFTMITGVNTLFNGLLNTPGFASVDFRHLRMSFGGGMATQEHVAAKWKKTTGVALIEGYGMTESSPVATINPIQRDLAFNGSIGLPLSSTDACVKDENGEMAMAGTVGELCIKGPQVMKGYWRNPEETAHVIDQDGWLHTGDMARMDEQGFIYIVDRKKDMILVSGFNVYPSEVESVLAVMPGILEVAAVGVPSEKSGEAVKVVIVRKDNLLTAEKVQIFARANLTAYKVPQFVEFREELPKSNVGKILRRELRASAPGS